MLKIFTTVRTAAAAIPAAEPAATATKAVTTAAHSMLTPVQVNDMIKDGKNRFSDVLIKGVSAMSAEKTKATLASSDAANSSY